MLLLCYLEGRKFDKAFPFNDFDEFFMFEPRLSLCVIP